MVFGVLTCVSCAATIEARVTVQTLPETAPRPAAVNEAAAAACAGFGLRLLLSALRRGNTASTDRASMLDPFVPLLAQGKRRAA